MNEFQKVPQSGIAERKQQPSAPAAWADAVTSEALVEGVSGSDPGCASSVANGINSTIGEGLDFSVVANSGHEHGGNWDYTLQSQSYGGDGIDAAAVAISIDLGLANTGLGAGPGTRGGGLSPSPHAPSATAVNLSGANTTVPPDWVIQINNAHNDTFNPNDAPLGTAGHIAWDVGVGTYLQSFGFSLGCHL